MDFEIEFEQEDDGRWIAEIPTLPGVMAYGVTKKDAESKVQAIALRVIADKIAGHIILLGEDEVADGTVTVKSFATGEQQKIPRTVLIRVLRLFPPHPPNPVK